MFSKKSVDFRLKIGYPCINRSIGCTANKTFRLKNFTKERFFETVDNNLMCLDQILRYNVARHYLFFRISSDIIPFASHPICKIDWQQHYRSELKKIGQYIKRYNVRISMHPDQFILINALRQVIITKSIKELAWHCQFLDLMGLNQTAKVQLHVGGAYNDKTQSMVRFCENYQDLPQFIKNRLVIENDDRIYSLADCMQIHKAVKIPILFDVFHHHCLNNTETVVDAMTQAFNTWRKRDGLPMVDYSSQEPGARLGKHTQTINKTDFEDFIKLTKALDFDIMLEIKDKEKSALKAVKIMEKHRC